MRRSRVPVAEKKELQNQRQNITRRYVKRHLWAQK